MATSAQLSLSYRELVIATQTPHTTIAFMHAHSTAMKEKVYTWLSTESAGDAQFETAGKWSI